MSELRKTFLVGWESVAIAARQRHLLGWQAPTKRDDSHAVGMQHGGSVDHHRESAWIRRWW